MRCRAGCPSPRRNLALLRITKFVTIRIPGLAVYFASLSITSFHMGTPYKIQKIPRTPGCNNGPPVQGISRFYLRQHRTIPALRLKHRSGGCGTASALPKCSIMLGCGTRIVLRGAKAPRTLRPLPLLRFAVSATGGAHLCSIQYYLRFWLGICRTSLAVSALRIMRYCPYACAWFNPLKTPRPTLPP